MPEGRESDKEGRWSDQNLGGESKVEEFKTETVTENVQIESEVTPPNQSHHIQVGPWEKGRNAVYVEQQDEDSAAIGSKAGIIGGEKSLG